MALIRERKMLMTWASSVNASSLVADLFEKAFMRSVSGTRKTWLLLMGKALGKPAESDHASNNPVPNPGALLQLKLAFEAEIRFTDAVEAVEAKLSKMQEILDWGNLMGQEEFLLPKKADAEAFTTGDAASVRVVPSTPGKQRRNARVAVASVSTVRARLIRPIQVANVSDTEPSYESYVAPSGRVLAARATSPDLSRPWEVGLPVCLSLLGTSLCDASSGASHPLQFLSGADALAGRLARLISIAATSALRIHRQAQHHRVCFFYEHYSGTL
ncbi:hypothetical protein HPB50_013939 [Hyalomma asiaticum]|uniref:Uncharacterized protein n=1 Tax=Hyalomma asiaticum TaxID=266040 RepID=A0ACB7RPV5_HYAAI|nr:hypothetical protein HPB50_013939 [Hyalomma asiaticum]